MLTHNRALILEGGGMRGIFTAGVLDYFMHRKISFPYTIGVSAGATNAISYISNQPGRSHYADTELLNQRPYIGLKTLIKRGELIDLDMLFNEFPNTIYPFDWETFDSNRVDLEIVATNIISGEPVYFSKPDSWSRLVDVAMASCSLPFLNRRVIVDGVPMLDGGLTDSIPLNRAFERGYSTALVVLTQAYGFRKPIGRFRIPSWIYRSYPKVIELLNSRAERYNAQMNDIEQLEKQGLIDVIRPTAPLSVGRLTTDIKRLNELHHAGYIAAQSWAESDLFESQFRGCSLVK